MFRLTELQAVEDRVWDEIGKDAQLQEGALMLTQYELQGKMNQYEQLAQEVLQESFISCVEARVSIKVFTDHQLRIDLYWRPL